MASTNRVAAMFKQGWNEIPELMLAGILSMFAMAGGFYKLHTIQNTDVMNKKYKLLYTIMRPDDPRVARIRKD